jgi:hypothetical protein
LGLRRLRHAALMRVAAHSTRPRRRAARRCGRRCLWAWQLEAEPLAGTRRHLCAAPCGARSAYFWLSGS